MQAARRLYLYVMSGITLAVIAAGLAILIDVILTGSGILQHPYDQYTSRREQLSQAIAMLVVGVPVWAVHWRLIERGMAPSRPERDAERGSTIRAIYLTLVLVVTLAVWVTGAGALVQYLIASADRTLTSTSYVDPVASVSMMVVGLIGWVFHVLVRRRDLSGDPVSGPAAWIPRLYLYGVSLAALTLAIGALQEFARGTIAPVEFDQGYGRFQVIESGVGAVATALVWLGHWWYVTRLAGGDGWRAADERVSRTRLAAFILTVVAATGFAVFATAGFVQGLLAPAIGRLPYDSSEATRLAFGSLAGAIPWTIAWWGHLRWLRREPAVADPLRALHQVRLLTHGMAAVGLTLGAVGLGWLLGLGIDIVFGGERMTDPNRLPWTFELAQFVPLAVLGLGLWAWQWSRVLARRRLDPEGEADSTIRRAFLYLTLAGSVVAALIGATLILYRLVGTIIGANLTGNAVSALSTPIGALIMAAVLLGYHGTLLRADQALRPAVVPAAVPAVAVPAGSAAAVAAGAGSRRTLELVGPEGADLDAALAAARSALPDGVRLEEPGAGE